MKALSVWVFAIYLAGCIASGAKNGEPIGAERIAKSAFWPVYIAYVEVDRYFDANVRPKGGTP